MYGFLHCKYQFPSIAAKVYVKINNQTVCQNMFNQKLVISDNSLICGSATDGFIEKVSTCRIQNFKNSKPFKFLKYRELKKEKEGRGFGRLPSFFVPPFWLFLIIVNPRKLFWSKFGRFLYFEDSNGFEFLKF